MQRTPPKSETLIPASAFTQTTILVETTRARVAVGRINDRVVVLKRFRAATANPDRCPASRRFAAERRYAWTLAADSDFILRPIASVVEAPIMALALPYCKFRSLDLLCRHPLTARWRTLLIADAARGVAHVHACGIILRDVKPGNCLVGDDGVARLADFELAGTAAELRLPAPKYSGGPAGKPRKTFEGTPEYVAPELLEAYGAAPARNSSADPMRAAATFASDVYALAVSANEVASGNAPYDGAERPDAQLQTVVETTYTNGPAARARGKVPGARLPPINRVGVGRRREYEADGRGPRGEPRGARRGTLLSGLLRAAGAAGPGRARRGLAGRATGTGPAAS